MSSILGTNWKTTLAGLGVALTAAAHLVTQISTGHFDPAGLYTDVMAIVGALGLFAAKDATTSR